MSKNKNKVVVGKDPMDKQTVVLTSKCELDTSIYRTKDNSNRFLTAEMFYDHPDNNNRYNKIAPYSLYNHEDITLENGMVVKSMRKIFMELDDSVGYECAIKTLGSKEHWDKLLSSSKIGEEIRKWIDELQFKELSMIKKSCKNEVLSMGKNFVQSSKIIISLNNQDPNSVTNRDKMVKEQRKENSKAMEQDQAVMQEQQLRLIEDYKRLNS